MSHNSSNQATHDWLSSVDSDRERLVVGPNGNQILVDSPVPSEPPPYSSLGEIPTHNLPPRMSREQPLSENNIDKVQNPKGMIGNYRLVGTLGVGATGSVRLAIHETTNDKLAIKIVPRKTTRADRLKDEKREIRTVREASIMLLLHHPYIVGLKEMVILDPYYYLFMEYVNGQHLLEYIISHGRLKESQSRQLCRQILSALDYCHRNSIVHRDLKIENILITKEGNVKIIDFGLSNLFSPRSSLSTFCGSLYFAAPELLSSKAYTGPEVDVWSFGVVLYVLVTGKIPFDDQSMPALHEKIKRGVLDYPAYLSTECKSILSRMLVVSTSHRATISELMVHPWMNKGYDAPIDNHLPDRLPLTLPINMEIVKQMTGFEFGTEEDIKENLERIVQSEEYQIASQVLFERTLETHRNHRQNQMISRFTPHSRSFVLPNEDPQTIPAAYHPLVSIYYLVKERMERERLIAEKEMEEHDAPLASPDMVIHPSRIENSSGISYHKKGKTHIRVEDDMNVEMDNKRQNIIDVGLNRLFSKSSHQKSMEAEERPEPETLFRRFSSVLSKGDTKNSKQIPDSIESQKQIPNGTVSTPLKPPTEPERVKTTTRRLTVGQAPLDGGFHLDLAMANQVHKTSATQGNADENIRPVFIKGLFSINTTTTKHPSVIRADLIRVLERIHVRWLEGKGLFECTHTPSIDLRMMDQAVPDLGVEFEICIVKVPWLLGMHGLQFRKLGGSAWQYRNMCNRILAELKL